MAIGFLDLENPKRNDNGNTDVDRGPGGGGVRLVEGTRRSGSCVDRECQESPK